MISCETRPGIYHNVLWYLIRLSISVLLIQPLVCRFIKTLIYLHKTTKINCIPSAIVILKHSLMIVVKYILSYIQTMIMMIQQNDIWSHFYIPILCHFCVIFFLFDYKYWMGWFLLEVKDISIPVCWRTKLILLILFCFHTPGSEKVKSW